MILKAICANCGVTIREGETIDGKVSHGVCLPCQKELYPFLFEPECPRLRLVGVKEEY